MAELNGNEFNFIASQLKLRKRGRLLSQKFLLGLYPKINIRKYSFISNTSGIHHVEDFFVGGQGKMPQQEESRCRQGKAPHVFQHILRDKNSVM